MAQKIGEETEIKVDLKTIGMIVGFTISLVSMYFALKTDIAEAKELPAPEVSKIEFSYKDEITRNSIINTNEKVEGLEKSVGEIKQQLDKIDERLYQISKK
ncbi:hypothetical protein CMO95_01920 [Candidatus Woesearchaeota archaeon]|nr:hypothetical protein [Candidatus Woesearchaeota archaeon]|tara:strand:- start:147 stop:449 length:303 start_codon:yes stop_codon:yes gene_type:complete